MSTPTRCLDCREGLDHCHGTLVVTVDEVVCSDPDCTDFRVERHALVVWELGD